MAVTLSQLSNQAQRRSWAPPTSTLMYSGESTRISQSQDFYTGYYMPPPVPYNEYRNQSDFATSHYPLNPQMQQDAPPLPPKVHSTSDYLFQSIEFPPTPPPRPSVGSGSSIEPDPLPPHSNPQALSVTQSQAFIDFKPVPPLRIDKDDVYCSETALAQYTILREAAHLPSFHSTKPTVTVMRTADGVVVGRVKFHALTTNSIDMTVHDHPTTLSHTYSLLHNQRWGFQSTTTPNRCETWYWKKDRSSKGAVLEDSKHKDARVLARMKGDVLVFEQGHLSQESYDEIVVSAVAVVEVARRAGKGKGCCGSWRGAGGWRNVGNR